MDGVDVCVGVCVGVLVGVLVDVLVGVVAQVESGVDTCVGDGELLAAIGVFWLEVEEVLWVVQPNAPMHSASAGRIKICFMNNLFKVTTPFGLYLHIVYVYSHYGRIKKFVKQVFSSP